MRAFHDHDTEGHSRYDAVSNREILGAGESAHREFTDNRAALLHLRENLFVLLGINHVDLTAQDVDCGARERTERALVGAGINAARQTADDYQISAKSLANFSAI